MNVKQKKRKRITVLGAGSWGTTLALLLDANGHEVFLWEYFNDLAESIAKKRVNEKYLPGVKVPRSITVSSDLEYSLKDSSHLLFVTPSHTVRNVARMVAASPPFRRSCVIINASKGLEEKSLCRMSEVLGQELPQTTGRIAGLLGPSHAEEVSRKMPTSIVVAGNNQQILERIQKIFMNEYFRVYTNTDLVGVELGVSLKNTIAIAAGICDGLGYGDNTKAALLTRGLAEIKRLVSRLGGREETLSGLSGVGDLIVTCMSMHSRNRYVGEQIGKGRSLQDILDEMVMVAEGVKTTRAAVALSRECGVELPIAEQVYKVLFYGKKPLNAIRDLMMRKAKREMYR